MLGEAIVLISVEAVIRGLGLEPGSFLNRYNDNRRAACEVTLDDCPVAEAVRQMVTVEFVGRRCEGTASALLRTLATYAPQNVTRTARWPKTPRSLSCTLRRIAPQLRAIGRTVSFDRVDNTRLIRIALSRGEDSTRSTAEMCSQEQEGHSAEAETQTHTQHVSKTSTEVAF
jgi:hypothetical protein